MLPTGFAFCCRYANASPPTDVPMVSVPLTVSLLSGLDSVGTYCDSSIAPFCIVTLLN